MADESTVKRPVRVAWLDDESNIMASVELVERDESNPLGGWVGYYVMKPGVRIGSYRYKASCQLLNETVGKDDELAEVSAQRKLDKAATARAKTEAYIAKLQRQLDKS